VEDVELRDELLQVMTLVFACVIGKEKLNSLLQPVMFQIRVNRLGIYPLVLGADGGEDEVSDGEVIRGAINDELL
jgi:hypothetical protein